MPLQLASIQSLHAGDREWPRAALLVIDEAHCAVSDTYSQVRASGRRASKEAA